MEKAKQRSVEEVEGSCGSGSSSQQQSSSDRNFPTLNLDPTNTQPVLVIQSPKTPTLSRKLKAISLDSDPKPQTDISRDVYSMPNTPKKQNKKYLTDFDSKTLAPTSNLKRFSSNVSISGSQTLKTLPEIMTLQDFSEPRIEPVRIKAKGLLERRGSNASLTIDLSSSNEKPPPISKLNTAKSISNLNLTSFGGNCDCPSNKKFKNVKEFDRRKSQIHLETCGNCTIYESVPSKANNCKGKLKLCNCICNLKCERKSLSNENLYVPPCNYCQHQTGALGNNQSKICKGNRTARYPHQADLEASQLLSDDFKLHLQNVQYLQTAGSVLTINELKLFCEAQRVPSLHQEFWEVPLNLQEKCIVSGSQSRNRYKGVLPNEHSRVHLSEVQPYIHANYIKGPDYTESSYIATQGPMAHTCEDFWEMIWLTKSNCIVMLTQLIEKGRNKCELYFPLGKSSKNDTEKSFYFLKSIKSQDKFTFDARRVYEEEIIKIEEVNEITFGQYKIKYLSKEDLGDCVLRHFALEKGKHGRKITHFWYPNWQDHKMADSEEVLQLALRVIKFIDNNKNIKRIRKDEKNPLVVHCSAGIGRTGCFLAILNGIQQLRSNFNVDVLAILCSLRLHRGGMVQTAEQYELIHKVLRLYTEHFLQQ